ncbi:hypothetical protein JCM33374_g1808 [Metschnikowia sp. JCM 33374]|nr:hypothetical protein JCM33374_g1808 [Metschnikowia sp. JCM 33374]
MGVHSLWDIVGPAARPVKLEALSRKRLAVDASIWIYQFMKAVRDKEGNSLGQTHIVGFFRRICKMLFFGILPLFVFDGGAPPLKRQVIQARKERRQGNQENAASTAQKLLAMQMHRKAASAGSGGHGPKKSSTPGSKTAVPGNDDTLYFDDLPMNHDERPPDASIRSSVSSQKPENTPNKPNTFRRKDEYHLPDLKQFTVRKDDSRIMPEGELEDYAADNSWDVVDGIPIDSVDPSSAEFSELPMATQYMILSHLRLRSRLRLGYSKDQLEDLFPNSRDFSKFQIQQVQKRNYYTQKLMTVSGMGEETGNVTRRIAGDKDRQYMLVKNEGGWTLSLGSGENEDDAIELDENGEVEGHKSATHVNNQNESEDSDDDLLEDVPLDNAAGVATSAKIEEDSDDELVNKAVIESIYDQYKHEYDDGPELTQTDASIQQKIESFRDNDLQQAIEESKKDYYQQKEKESHLQHKVADPPLTSDFEFGNSILFGAPAGIKDDPPLLEQAYEKDASALSEVIDVDDHSETTKESEKPSPESQNRTMGEEPKQTNNIPSWFNDSSHLQSSYSSIGFLSDTQGNRKIDENEEAGLIPWNEAKRYFEESSGQTNFHDLQADSIQEEGDNDSDLEIIEEVRKENPQEKPKLQETTENNENQTSNNGTLTTDESHPKNDLEKSQNKESFSNPRLAQEGSTRPHKVPKKVTTIFNQAKPASPQRETVSVDEEPANTSANSVTNHNNKTQNSRNASEKAQVSTKLQQQTHILDYDFDESEEEDLVKQLREEEQEHVHFTSSIQLDQIPIHTKVSSEQLLQEQLQKAKRDAEEVTQTMINDVQELLKRFGIPYITAPMEAEAQCAELYKLGLVDGIVTDDSDCFLFGGSRIYKNMFNQKQYVECYIADDIEHKVGLDQKKLIELALLLGSDYTEGVKGIGPVLAMEILAEFGSLDAFKQWFDEITKTLKKPDVSRNSKLEKTLLSRIKNGKLFLSDTFPDQVVVEAYKRPEVDHDESEFKWGVPSLDQIRSFLMYNVGWSQERVDEVMVPLIRNINKTRTGGQQTTISEFFPQEYISYRKDVGMGKRMKAG